VTPEAIATTAFKALEWEIDTTPKPGLVSPIDSGSHDDMNAALLRRSAEALQPYFAQLARAGARQCDLRTLRCIGRAAENAMLIASGGVNTHRGAIFGLGLLCAAAGMPVYDAQLSGSLGDIVRERWGASIGAAPVDECSHGAQVQRRYGAGGARAQAAGGFMHVYEIAWPALTHGRQLAAGDENAARVHCCFALMASLVDTNLLHRGGIEGWLFAREQAIAFMTNGGVGNPHWHTQALGIHREFVARRLSPGGCADLLAMTLFVDACHAALRHPNSTATSATTRGERVTLIA
jgi:triphosphoribosyl-dephospho-CoA synthase